MHHRRSIYLNPPFVVVAVVLTAFAIWNFSTSQQRSHDKLVRESYSGIEMTGWKPFAWLCDSRLGIARGFVAKDAVGRKREGYVCSNPFFSYIVD